MAKKKYKSKHDKEKQKKRELEESLDYLKEVEKPGGREFVIDKLKADEAEEKQAEDDIKNYLESSSKANFEYRSKLANYAQTKLEELDFPPNWEHYAIPTDGGRVKIFTRWFKSQVGVLMILKDNGGNVYTRGIKVTYKPVYDVSAIRVLVNQAENTIDSAKGILLSENGNSKLKKTKSGIILPE